MKAVILAAGRSSRFYPYNYFSHKSLIKILGRPIIVHTVESVKRSGIKEIILIISKDSEIKKLLGNGKNFGVNIRYVIQKEPTGAGNGLLLAEKFIEGDFFLLNVSHVDFWEFKELILAKKSKNDKGVLLAREEGNLEKYGVLKIERDRVLDLVEKPKKGKEPSNLRLIGIYLFSLDFLKTLRQTPNEHYRLEKAISNFSKNHQVKFLKTKKEVSSLKYSWDLLSIKNYLLKNIKKSIGKNVKIAESSEIIGNVIIENGVEVMEGAKIKGPCFIGKNSIIGNNTILRNGVDVEENCVIGANMEVKNSLIMRGTKVHSGFIGDSVIGEDSRIGADFSTANVRLDRQAVRAEINGQKIDTGLKRLGTIIGSNVKVGIKSSTMPGVLIGGGSIIGPSTVVLQNVPESTKYYTKFKEIVVKK
ncbi:MAG: hypothetical protein A3B44_02415 [Candidatus Levybacteria bacterium RIFCSPLOWO2_01_FULL_38_21]|nr:MAG: hypothetical protein A3B44_02415 [Candidatus Levybacteria bacterium RIFCSPLOWO2_01_FULL_38_21]